MKINDVALIAGSLVVGAAIGVLFAPKKGSETRKDITDGTKDLANTVKDNVDKVMTEVSQKFTEIKNNGKEIVARGKEKLNDATKAAQTAKAEYKRNQAVNSNGTI